MNGERAILFATDPPYLVDYDGSNHPTRNKDWSASYGNTWDDSSQGSALYDGFIAAAVAEAIEENAAWYCWHAETGRGGGAGGGGADVRRGAGGATWQGRDLHTICDLVRVTPVCARYSAFVSRHADCIRHAGPSPRSPRCGPMSTRNYFFAKVSSFSASILA